MQDSQQPQDDIPQWEWIQDLNRSYGWQLGEQLTAEEAELLLAEKLNELIRADFGKLVQLLYRIDISEARLREHLQANSGEDAGRIIARMIIERLVQKIKTRRQFRRDSQDIPEDERW